MLSYQVPDHPREPFRDGMLFPCPAGTHGNLPAVLLLPESFRHRGKGGSEPALSDLAGAAADDCHRQIRPVFSPVRGGRPAGAGHDAPGQSGLFFQMVPGLQLEAGAGFLQFPFLRRHEPGHVSAALQGGVPEGEGLGILCACAARLPGLYRVDRI